MKKVQKDNVVLEELNVEYMNVDDIQPNTYNPNRQGEHEFELLCRSIEEDGFTQPCVVRRSDNMIVDGEHRWRAAQSIGYKEIPVVKVEMTDAQMRIATLRHNRARGEEDADLAAAVLKDLAAAGALDHAADSLMLDESEVDALMQFQDPEILDAPGFEEIHDPYKREDGTVAGRHEVVAGTPEASDKLRENRDLVASMKKDQDRAAMLREMDNYRVNLIFTGSEAEIVKKVLGREVAQNILVLCTKYGQQEQTSGEEE
jgi:ParB/RepB/Spo0J family partition protein